MVFWSSLFSTLLLHFLEFVSHVGVGVHPPLTFVLHWSFVSCYWSPLVLLLPSCGPGHRILVLIRLFSQFCVAWLWVGWDGGVRILCICRLNYLSWGNLPQNLFGGERHFAPKNPKGKISVCPKIFAMAEDPKATLLGKRSIMPILRFFFFISTVSPLFT